MLARDADAVLFVGDHCYADEHLSNATDDQLHAAHEYYPNLTFKYDY